MTHRWRFLLGQGNDPREGCAEMRPRWSSLWSQGHDPREREASVELLVGPGPRSLRGVCRNEGSVELPVVARATILERCMQK
eukprot:4999930-Pyramimonas_sp.AAC.1